MGNKLGTSIPLNILEQVQSSYICLKSGIYIKDRGKAKIPFLSTRIKLKHLRKEMIKEDHCVWGEGALNLNIYPSNG
jgi:hypothetical protein